MDISLDEIVWKKVDLENDPIKRDSVQIIKREKPYLDISKKRDQEEGLEFAVEADPNLVDFYTTYRPWETADSAIAKTTQLYEKTFSKKEKKEKFGNKNYYELSFTNHGGLVMPVFIEWTYADGTTEVERIPVEVWRKNENGFTKAFVKEKEVKDIRLDPYRQTADVDESNNTAPMPQEPIYFKVFKEHNETKLKNPMQRAKEAKIKPWGS